ncbi:MAG: hypothetical protein IKO57_05190 [Treponema sp.]|nr:hypothetical protein [Treponema sp.]
MKTENGKLKKYKLGDIEKTISEEEYSELLKSAKTQIDTSRSTLAFQVNSTANATYWNLGKLLHEQKIDGGYGSDIKILMRNCYTL